jgi:hypothetical protein
MRTSFIVDISVEVITNDYDRASHARVAARFAANLPFGSQVLENRSATDSIDGMGHARVRIPATRAGSVGALHAVALALELAVFPEPSGLDSLGPISATTTREAGDGT